MVEDVGERDEDQARAAVRLHTVREAGREDNKSRADRHKGVQNDDIDGLSHQRLVAPDIASENGHGTDTDTECEESLVHGTHNYLENTDFFSPFQTGLQIELQSFARSGKENAVDRQDHHDHEQRQHHDFCDLLEAVLKPLGVYKESEDHDDSHAAHLDQRIGEAARKSTCHLLRVKILEASRRRSDKILKHPPCYRCVVHHEQVVADHA